MITEPDYNSIRIAVEKTIALHSYEHTANQIRAKDLPGLAKCALLASATHGIAMEYVARVNAIRNGRTRQPQGKTVHILDGAPTPAETRKALQGLNDRLPPNVTLH